MNRSRDYAKLLLRRAQEDGHLVARVVEDLEVADWIIGFHTQQCLEKAIKAVLSHHNARYPHTHDLGILIKLLEEQGVDLPLGAEGFRQLTPYGAMLRYEGDPAADPKRPFERAVALERVRRTLDWASRLIRERDPARSR